MLTLLSRVLGLVRDVTIAFSFAVGLHTDAFFAAFKIPNLLRRLTAEGAFTQAFVPVYNSARESNKSAQLRNIIASWLTCVLALISVCGIIGAPLLIAVLAPGFAEIEGKSEAAVTLLRITFPYILLISLTAFGGAVLNSYGRFAAFAFAPALLNISLIGCAILLAPQLANPIEALAWGVIIGGLAQLSLQAAAMYKYGKLPRLAWPRLTPEMKKLLKLTGLGAIGVSIAQFGIVINLVFASFLADGSVSWLYFADRMMELPTGLLGAALGVIVLPTLSRQAHSDQQKPFSITLDWSLRIAVLLGLPAAFGMAVLALPLAATFFQHGNYTPLDSVQTSLAMFAYSFGVPALVCIKTLTAGFYSRQEIMVPVKISAVALAVTVAMNFALVPLLQHAGLALAIAIGVSVNALLLLGVLLYRHIYQPQPGWPGFLLRVLCGCVVMTLLLLWLRGQPSEWTQITAIERIAGLAIAASIGVATYFASLWLTGWRPSQMASPAL